MSSVDRAVDAIESNASQGERVEAYEALLAGWLKDPQGDAKLRTHVGRLVRRATSDLMAMTTAMTTTPTPTPVTTTTAKARPNDNGDDLDAVEKELQCVCLQALGTLLFSKPAMAVFTAVDMRLVMEAVLTVLQTTASKDVCLLCVWCIAQQRTRGRLLLPFLPRVVHAVAAVMANPWHSRTLQNMVLQAVERLLLQHHQAPVPFRALAT